MSASRLPAVKAWQLKYWAFLTGAQTTGTKAELQTLLTSRLNDSARRDRPTKIVSVDMGIRNLAYCALEAPALDLHAPDTGLKRELSQLKKTDKELLRHHSTPGHDAIDGLRKRLDGQAITVTAWKRLDLTKDTNDSATSKTNQHPEHSPPKPSTDLFTPSQLSRTALKVTQELLSHNPTTILIERQRFRSGGAAAIQEWTVRVNMLESMIWACLETLKDPDSSPDVRAVNPATVANFWSSPASISLLPPTLFSPENTAVQRMVTDAMGTRTKMEKKGKVDLVKKWCRAFGADSEVPLKFRGDARNVSWAFKEEPRRRGRGEFEGKLDDVADCLLQGVTWVRWEQNRRVLGEMWRKAVEEEAKREEAS